jgi:YHS domain-containing protein
MTRILHLLVFLIAAPLLVHGAKPVNTTLLGTAIKGYDPVAYFVSGKPAKGDSKFSHEWNGATWRFSSDENREKFKQSPEKYAPQFGGYCAWAVSQNYTANSDPENAWKIVDGKLYLNYDRKVQQKWEADTAANIAKGETNWVRLRKD